MFGDTFKDDAGHNSSMRVIWAITVLIVFITWAYVCIANKTWVSFSTGDSVLMGVLFGSKVWSKIVENKTIT